MKDIFDSKFIKVVQQFAKVLILGIWSVIMFVLFLACIIHTVDMVQNLELYFINDSVYINLLWIAVAFISITVMIVFVKKIMPNSIFQYLICHKNHIGIVVTVAVAIFLIWWISITMYEPAGDALLCMQIADDFLHGDRNSWLSDYMSIFPFQNGLVFFDMLLILAFGNNAYVAFQYINVIFFIIGVIAVYVTCKYMFKKENSIFVWFALALYYPFAIYVVYCYGNMIGFSLAAVAGMFLYIYFDNRKLIYIALCAVSITLSIIMKLNYSIVMIGIILYLLYDIIAQHINIKKTGKENRKRSAIALIIIITIYLTGVKSAGFMFDTITGVHNEGMPKIAWVAMGMNDAVNVPGWQDGYSSWVYNKNERDRDATVQECKQHIVDRIQILLNQKRLIKFYYKKITSQWNEPTFECFNLQMVKSNTPDNSLKKNVFPGNNQIYKDVLNICQTLINFGVLMYIFKKWRNFHSLSVYELFNAVLMIGAFIFWTVWEAKSQYVIPYYYLIIPYAVLGWKAVTVKTVLILSKKVNLKETGKN